MERENQALEKVTLHFPCDRAFLNYERDIQSLSCEAFRTQLFIAQRDYQARRINRDAWVSCACVERGRARFLIKCLTKEKGEPLLYLARFPKSGPLHAKDCYFRWHEVAAPATSEGSQAVHVRPTGRDFAACFRSLGDPEWKATPVEASAARISDKSAGRRRLHRESISLRSFGAHLLELSGMCEWRPRFRVHRNQTVFDGRIAGAADFLAKGEALTKAARFVQGLPGNVPIVRWSMGAPDGTGLASKCIGYGFVGSIGSLSETGARELKLKSRFAVAPLLIPRTVLAKVGGNPESPLGTGQKLGHPVWVIFVAQKFGDEWKIHEMAGFRVTEVGGIPVSSDFEEAMALRLINEHREFRRCLTPPVDLGAGKYIPDFQLLDTPMHEYLEVAGMMGDAAYARQMAVKRGKLGDRLLVWDCRQVLAKFELPIRGPSRTRNQLS